MVVVPDEVPSVGWRCPASAWGRQMLRTLSGRLELIGREDGECSWSRDAESVAAAFRSSCWQGHERGPRSSHCRTLQGSDVAAGQHARAIGEETHRTRCLAAGEFWEAQAQFGLRSHAEFGLTWGLVDLRSVSESSRPSSTSSTTCTNEHKEKDLNI